MSKKHPVEGRMKAPPNFIFNSAEGGIKETPPNRAEGAEKETKILIIFLGYLLSYFLFFKING
jgi:hypothetical protein